MQRQANTLPAPRRSVKQKAMVLGIAALMGVISGPRAALADVRTFTGTDRHLYLNEFLPGSASGSLQAGWLAKDVLRPANDTRG